MIFNITYFNRSCFYLQVNNSQLYISFTFYYMKYYKKTVGKPAVKYGILSVSLLKVNFVIIQENSPLNSWIVYLSDYTIIPSGKIKV